MVLMVCLAASVNAQMSGTRFGVKAGANFSNVNVEGTDADIKATSGLHLGVLAHVHVTDRFAFQPELVYSMQGAKSEFAGEDSKLKLHYINIPVLGQVMFGDGFRLQTGPQVGFLLSAKEEDEDVKEDFNKIDFSWSFGASYVTSTGIGFDARYNLGLSNISESDEVKARNRVFQVGIFYLFGGTK